MPGDDVVSGQICHGVGRNVRGCGGDGLIAVLEILRSDRVHHQAELVVIVFASGDSGFENAVRRLGGNLACLAGNNAAGEAGVEKARIGKHIKV